MIKLASLKFQVNTKIVEVCLKTLNDEKKNIYFKITKTKKL